MTEALADTPTVAVVERVPLKSTDACDPCGFSNLTEAEDKGISQRTYQLDAPYVAQARVRATFPSGNDLLFCGHCYREHEAALLEAGATIQDERDTLVTKPAWTTDV
jgi:hypothetical protein